MFFSFATVSALALAAVSSVSANPLPRKTCTVTGQAVVATVQNTPISGYYLGVGTGHAVVLLAESNGLSDTSAFDGSIGFWYQCKEKWLNYDGDDASTGTQSLIWGSTEETLSWVGAPGQNPIYNIDYHSDNFQVCDVDGQWIVKLVTPAAGEDASCYYTQLQILGDSA